MVSLCTQWRLFSTFIDIILIIITTVIILERFLNLSCITSPSVSYVYNFSNSSYNNLMSLLRIAFFIAVGIYYASILAVYILYILLFALELTICERLVLLCKVNYGLVIACYLCIRCSSLPSRFFQTADNILRWEVRCIWVQRQQIRRMERLLRRKQDHHDPVLCGIRQYLSCLLTWSCNFELVLSMTDSPRHFALVVMRLLKNASVLATSTAISNSGIPLNILQYLVC